MFAGGGLRNDIRASIGGCSQPSVSQGIIEKSQISSLPPIPPNYRKIDPGVTKNIKMSPKIFMQDTKSMNQQKSKIYQTPQYLQWFQRSRTLDSPLPIH